MSKNYTQVTYKCKCMGSYGDECNGVSKFVLRQNASIDTNTIFHKPCDDEAFYRRNYNKDDFKSEWGVWEANEYISDPEICALQDVLVGKNNVDPEIDPSFRTWLKIYNGPPVEFFNTKKD